MLEVGLSSPSENIHDTNISLGLGVLFGKLQQGVAENQQILTIARMRAAAEDTYGIHLGEIGPAAEKITGGFSKDDGASVRKVCIFLGIME
jgi:hypothetical protein